MKGKRKQKQKQKNKKKTNLSTLIGLLYYFTLLSKELLLFSTIPIPVEIVMPIRTIIAVHLIVSFVVNAFKDVRA